MIGKNFSEKTSVLIATWFGSGLIRPVILKGMAGTYGSLASIPLCYLVLWFVRNLMNYFDFAQITAIYLMILIVIYNFGSFTVPLAQKVLGPRRDWKGKIKDRDQNEIVIDEVLGMLVACYPVAFMKIELFSWPTALMIFLAFLYFRFFDIVKFWPIRQFDDMKTAFGVMMDDVVAGVYAALVLQVTYYLFF